jgi:hypothetical protein
MSLRYLSAVTDLPGTIARGNARNVLWALANRANERGECWPGLPRVAAEAGMSVRSAQRHIKALVARGLLAATAGYNARGQRVEDHYRLCLPGTPSCGAGDKLSPGAGDSVVTAPVTKRARAGDKTGAPYKEEPSGEPSKTTPLPPVEAGGGGAAEQPDEPDEAARGQATEEADGPDPDFLEAEALLSSVGVIAYGRPRDLEALKADLEDPKIGLAGVRRAVAWCRQHGKRPNSYAYLAAVARSDRPPRTGKPDASKAYHGGKNGF